MNTGSSSQNNSDVACSVRKSSITSTERGPIIDARTCDCSRKAITANTPGEKSNASEKKCVICGENCGRPALLDLFSGAGGAAWGYKLAGFCVLGIDHKPQPRYRGCRFIQADALEYVREHGKEYDAIHASPPCQAYSVTKNFTNKRDHPDLLASTRKLLIEIGRPWVIENVPGAPMTPHYVLCGCMFNLPRLRRVRWFETSWIGFQFDGTHVHQKNVITVAGHGVPSHQRKFGRSVTLDERKAAMGIDWMGRDELGQAIPPAYTEWIGKQLLRVVHQ